MPLFKKPRKNFRQKQESSDSDSEEEREDETTNVVEMTRQLQRLRKKPKGVNAEDLVTGKELPKKEKGKKDPLKIETGGFVDIKTLRKELREAEDIEQIGTTFAAETNTRDEDAEMLKYVEVELKKRKGVEEKIAVEKSADPLDALYELPEHIKALTENRKKTEDMLSNQMLSGIPEMDLGIEAKIKNIEATEEAKQKIIQDRMKAKEKVSVFVPTNMAVNFVQHNRFNIEDTTPFMKKEAPAQAPAPLRVGDADKPSTSSGKPKSSKSTEKSTDDYHYERFKKQVRRY